MVAVRRLRRMDEQLRVRDHLTPTGKNAAAAAPQVVVVFSGKRKSGKDFVCEQLLDALGAQPFFERRQPEFLGADTVQR